MRTRTLLGIAAAAGALVALPGGAGVAGAAVRGASCRAPFQIQYQRGSYFRGDTHQIRITSSHRQISTGVSRITFRWRALNRNRVCGVTLVDGQGRLHRLPTGSQSGSYSFRQGEGPYPFESFTITAARHR